MAGRGNHLLKHLLCTAVLICGATALRADVFSFSYAGAGVSASLTLTANSIGSGAYTVTGITGTRNGKAITNWLGGIFYYSSGSPFLDGGGVFSFGISGYLGVDTVLYVGGNYEEEMVGLPTTTTTLSSFTMGPSTLPEPSTLLILLTMGLGFWIMARKLPSKKTQ
jgi:hypothetical protein